MNLERFEFVTRLLQEKRQAIVAAKRPEYTEGNLDVLNNFKVVAAELGITPIQVWYVYFRKHIMSISQFATDSARTMSEPIDGRICDAINYLELLNGLIEDQKQPDTNTFTKRLIPHSFENNGEGLCTECKLNYGDSIHIK